MSLCRRYLRGAVLCVYVYLIYGCAGNAFAAEGVFTFPTDLHVIEQQAHYKAVSMKEAILPESITRIESQAFAFSGLQKINLPESIRSIAEDAFLGCDHLLATCRNDYTLNYCQIHDIDVAATALLLDQSTMYLTVDDTMHLNASVVPAQAIHTPIWHSDNTSIATVDNQGNVTAVGRGTTAVSATVDGVTASCVVYVEEAAATLSVTHEIIGNILAVDDAIEIWNGPAHQTWTVVCNYPWRLETTGNWYTVDTVSSSAGSTVVVLQIPDGVESGSRSGEVSFYVNDHAIASVSIKQTATVTPEATPAPIASLSVSHELLGDVLNAGTIEMFNGPAYQTWTITSNRDWYITTVGEWFTVNRTSGIAGNSTLVLSMTDGVAAGDQRTGSVTFYVDEKKYSVVEFKQVGVHIPDPEPSLTVTHVSLGDILASEPIEMWNGDAYQTWTVNSNCAWTLKTTGTWYSIDKTSGAAGTTQIRLTFPDGAAAGETRNGSIKFFVNGSIYDTVNIFQAGPEETINTDPSYSISISHAKVGDIIAASPITVFNGAASMNWTVTANFDWTITTSSSWFTVSPKAGSAGVATPVALQFTGGISSGTRSDTIKFKRGSKTMETITVMQDSSVSGQPDYESSLTVSHKDWGELIGNTVYMHNGYASQHWSVVSNTSWSISTSGDDDWFSITPTSGTAGTTIVTLSIPSGVETGKLLEGTVKFVYYKNSGSKVTKKVYVSQYGGPAVVTEPPEAKASLAVMHEKLGDILTVGDIEMWNGFAHQTWTVTSNTDWNIKTTGGWFNVSRTSGNANTNASPTTSLIISIPDGVAQGQKRTGTVEFYLNGSTKVYATVRIYQSGGVAPTLDDAVPSMTVSSNAFGDVLSVASIQLENIVKSYSWTITANRAWAATANGGWFTVSPSSSNAGTATDFTVLVTQIAKSGETLSGTIVFTLNGIIYKTVSLSQCNVGWDRYAHPAPKDATSIISVAASQRGYTEGSGVDEKGVPYENDTKYGEALNANRAAWCASFVTWCARQASISTSVIPDFAGCTEACNYTLPNRCNAIIYDAALGKDSYNPKAGDLIFFDGSGAGYSGHVGIVEKYSDGNIWYYDGNGASYSGDSLESKDHTKVDYRRVSIWSSKIYAYASINYNDVNGTSAPSIREPKRTLQYYSDTHCTLMGPDVRWVQQTLQDLGYSITADGIFGSGTSTIVKRFQADSGITSDGVVGSATLAALKKRRESQTTGGDDASSQNALTNEQMLACINASSTISYSKKSTCLLATRTMLSQGFAPAFIAGMLANICCEGNWGWFEGSDSTYTSKYPRFAYLEKEYSYIKNYSYKYIYNGFSLTAVESMAQATINAGYNDAFGLGICQWTHEDRLPQLLAFYKAETSLDTITLEQCKTAEIKMMIYELGQGGSYRSVYTNWKASNSSYSTQSAYNAGYTICYNYEKPANTANEADERGNLARTIYLEMMGQ